MARIPPLKRAGQRGCTLIEMYFILALYAAIITAITLVVVPRVRSLHRATTLRTMRAVEVAVVQWQAEHQGQCPTTLAALAPAGYLSRRPVDAWRRPLQIARCSKAGLMLYSVGADGQPRTSDDVLSWAPTDQRWVQAPPRRPLRVGPRMAKLLGLILCAYALRRLWGWSWARPAPAV